MEYIEAIWEKENLNSRVLEIKLQNSDILDDVFINKIKQYDYIVTKMSEFSQKLSQQLSKHDFYYVETMCQLEADSSRLKKILSQNSNYSYKIDNSEEKCRIVMSRVTFNTDRISFDTNFGVEIANQRYFNWMNNFIKNNNAQLAIIYDGKTEIGFTFFVEKVNSFEFILSGIFNEYVGKGHGNSIMYIYQRIIENSAKKAETSISTNNMGSLHTHIKAGYIVTDCESVFVKHNK